jgi:hypothetical protein
MLARIENQGNWVFNPFVGSLEGSETINIGKALTGTAAGPAEEQGILPKMC